MVLNRHWIEAYENGELTDPARTAVDLYEFNDGDVPEPVPEPTVAGVSGWEFVFDGDLADLDLLTESELIDLADWLFAEGVCLEYEMGAIGGVYTELKALAAFRQELDSRLSDPVETYV